MTTDSFRSHNEPHEAEELSGAAAYTIRRQLLLLVSALLTVVLFLLALAFQACTAGKATPARHSSLLQRHDVYHEQDGPRAAATLD